jgi:hypothetical protein
LALAVMLLSPGGTVARAETPPPGLLPLEEVSPVFLGMYRKVMEIEADIKRYSERYGVDFDLARAVCLYESGGNVGSTPERVRRDTSRSCLRRSAR